MPQSATAFNGSVTAATLRRNTQPENSAGPHAPQRQKNSGEQMLPANIRTKDFRRQPPTAGVPKNAPASGSRVLRR
jgi:hypothetical protein